MAQGIRSTVPLYLECKWPGCGRLRQVRRPCQQRRGGYCSRRCAAITNRNIARADHVAAGRESGRRRRNSIKARLRGLTKLEGFLLGYRNGLQSKWRSLRRKYVLVKREGA